MPVECLVRGICALKPGVEGLSERVRVRSILGRYLEHSRVFSFRSTGEFWMGSADMMHRNLDRRIETLVTVRRAELKDSLRAMLDHAFSDQVSAWELGPDGSWTRRVGDEERPGSNYQADLATWALERARR